MDYSAYSSYSGQNYIMGEYMDIKISTNRCFWLSDKCFW